MRSWICCWAIWLGCRGATSTRNRAVQAESQSASSAREADVVEQSWVARSLGVRNHSGDIPLSSSDEVTSKASASFLKVEKRASSAPRSIFW
jgi:hypothetical protein